MADRDLIKGDSVATADQAPSCLTLQQLEAAQTIVDLLPAGTAWKDIATEIGVDVTTLRRWRGDPAFQDEIVKRSRRSLREHIPTGHTALIRNVRKGDNQAIKMLFELTGEYQEAKMRELLGAWMDSLAVAGIPEVRRLMARVRASQEAGGTGAYVRPPVDVQDAVVIDEPGGNGKRKQEEPVDVFEI